MANTKQSKKRARQAPKKTLRNTMASSAMRTSIKKTLKAIQEKNKELASTSFKGSVKILDSLASKGIIHKNKAARLKSQLSKKLRSAA